MFPVSPGRFHHGLELFGELADPSHDVRSSQRDTVPLCTPSHVHIQSKLHTHQAPADVVIAQRNGQRLCRMYGGKEIAKRTD